MCNIAVKIMLQNTLILSGGISGCLCRCIDTGAILMLHKKLVNRDFMVMT